MIEKLRPGIMFHHFWSANYKKTPGALNKTIFKTKLNKLSKKFNLLSANNYLELLKSNKLKKNDIFVSFDDALKCQIDIALPVLDSMKIKAFFFIYTSIFDNRFSRLELYRDFRYSKFKNIDDFYKNFFYFLKTKYPSLYKKSEKSFNKNFLKQFKYYSLSDKKFRHARNLISEKKYNFIMDQMIKDKKYNVLKKKKELLMNKNDIRDLSKNGHIIGLHSHSHFTDINKKSFNIQYFDFKKNKSILEKITNKTIDVASYPCGNYGKNTIKVLKKININFAMRADDTRQKKNYEIPRIDHTLIKL
tara:strand:- start:514 stop:1425 length:912 start_codon:yes stop_codon:yes gene_type:complete